MDLRSVPNETLFTEFNRRVRCSELPERRIIFIGPPGAGKGTVAPKMVEEFCVCHLSTGDMLRAAVTAGTDLGKQAKDVMARGELVSDDLIIGLIKENMTRPDCLRGVLLDGFPRTMPQAEKLDQILSSDNQALTHVLNMEVDDSLLVDRICGRRIHKASGRSYHVKFNPPQVADVDDITGEPLIQRSDDNEAALVTRLAAFHAQTTPIVGYYSSKGIVHNIDAAQTMDSVWDQVLGAFN